MYIVEPKTKKYLNLNSKKGINILKKYIKTFLGGNKKRSKNLCNIIPVICKGNLGFKRNEMPQIETADDFTNVKKILKQQLDNIFIKKTKINFKKLKAGKTIIPIQNQLSSKIINRICKKSESVTTNKIPTILIVGSKTPNKLYVLDGHHRSFSGTLCGPNINQVAYQIKVQKKTSKQSAKEIMKILKKYKPDLFKKYNI